MEHNCDTPVRDNGVSGLPPTLEPDKAGVVGADTLTIELIWVYAAITIVVKGMGVWAVAL